MVCAIVSDFSLAPCLFHSNSFKYIRSVKTIAYFELVHHLSASCVKRQFHVAPPCLRDMDDRRGGGWMGSGSSKRVSVFVLGEEKEEEEGSSVWSVNNGGGRRSQNHSRDVCFSPPHTALLLLNISSALSASDHSQRIHK